MQVNLLGPLEMRTGDLVVQVAGSRLRRLLVRLAVTPGHAVAAVLLVDAVWPDAPPADAANALQSLVSRLRRTLGDPALVEQAGSGYRLVVDETEVDVHRFALLAGQGRALLERDDAVGAATALRESLALWRGPALVDAGDAAYAQGVVARLDEERLAAVADRVEADLRLGGAAELVGELDELTTEHPLDERLAGLRLRALAASGRNAEAIAAYEALRARLVDELGIDPSPALQEQHLVLLRGEQTAPPAPASAVRRPRRSNLRNALTTFIGRDAEVERITSLLATGRLVTVVGPGGAGKTRISGEVASRLVDSYADGVWLVELAPVTEAANLVQAFLGAIGMREGAVFERLAERDTRGALQRLLDALAGADCLLVVDNCEHLVQPVAQVVDQVLAGSPAVRVLTTSREPLGIAGEALCVLPPLGLPQHGASPGEALTYPSVQLFQDRARAVRADFSVRDATVADVVEIVRRLDGLPLAIELAAARLRVLPVDEIATRISDRFRLLTGGSRTAMPRHRTLRAVVEWSWDLLTPAERTLAERLAVFPAGVTVETATAICRGTGLADEVPELLDALVDKSLLEVVDGSGLRYRMLETIREYGIERLVDQGAVSQVRAVHADVFAALVRTADPHLRSRDQLAWKARLDEELDNVLAALRYLADRGDSGGALELATGLSWFWTMSGNRADQATWLSFALAVPGSSDAATRLLAEAALAVSDLDFPGPRDAVDPAERSDQLQQLATELTRSELGASPLAAVLVPVLLFFGGDKPGMAVAAARAVESDDPWVRSSALAMRAAFAENEGDLVAMRADVSAAATGFEEIGDRWGLAAVRSARAHVRTLDGDLVGALVDLEQSLVLQAEIGSTEDETFTRLRLAEVRARLGDLAGAEREIDAVRQVGLGPGHWQELVVFALASRVMLVTHAGDSERALQLRDQLAASLAELPPASRSNGHARAVAIASSAVVALEIDDVAGAQRDLETAYPIALGTRDQPIIASVGVAVACLALALDRPTESAAVLGAAARLRGSPDHTDPWIIRLTARLRAALGDAYDAAFDAGWSLGPDEATARLDPTSFVGPSRAG